MSTTDQAGAAPPPEHTRPVLPPTEMVLRASDAERTETVERLHQALGAGRLDLAETDERVASAYAARHRHELSALLTDLPAADVTFGEAPSWAALWALAVWRVRTYLAGSPTARPTSGHLRTAVVLTTLAGAWIVACAVLGAVVVGA